MPFLAGQRLHAEDIDLVPVETEQEVDVTTTSTSYVFGSTALSATFTAPPSGRVLIQVSGTQDNNTALESSFISFQVREGTTQVGTLMFDGSDVTAYRTAGTTRIQAGAGKLKIVTGLTSGATYTAWGRIRVTGGTGTWYRTGLLVYPTL